MLAKIKNLLNSAKTKYWLEALEQALDELMHHKLRTLLTLLGIIFGVGAMISMLSVGEGAEQEALELIDSMGMRNIIVNAKDYDAEELIEIRQHSAGLSLIDVDIAKQTLTFVEHAAALKEVKSYAVISDFGSSSSPVFGVTPGYFTLSNAKLAAGEFFTEQDNLSAKQVAVIGQNVATKLFAEQDPIGQYIKVNHLWLQVVGVLQGPQLTKSDFQGVKLAGEGSRIYLPLFTVSQRLKFEDNANELDSFKLQLQHGIDPNMAAASLSHLLERRHGGVSDFEIIVPAQLMQQHQKTQRIFNIVMSCVAGISLLVGGIGIMNIMLATILERTKEIGLLRAIGATQKDIRNQFMVECCAITVIGGILGIVFGLVLSLVIAIFAGWPVAWSGTAIIISVTVCSIIGLVFGIYPAMKASKLDPIVALQSD